MNLIDTLKLLDTQLFLFLNGLNLPFFDGIMFAISEKMVWIPFYISIVYIAIKYWKRESIWIILSLILCIVIADQVASGILKDLVQRPRPSHAIKLQGLVHLVNDYRGGSFGFVSSHAANAFGFALLTSLLFKNRRYAIVIFSWAILTAYSRIYIGVHYPLDIIGGVLVGVLAAFLCFWLIQKLRPSLLFSQTKTDDNPLNTKIPLFVIAITFLSILVYAFLIQFN